MVLATSKGARDTDRPDDEKINKLIRVRKKTSCFHDLTTKESVEQDDD